MEQKKTERQIKKEEFRNKIYDAYSNFRNASSPDLQLKYFSKFMELVYKWCAEYHFTKLIKVYGLLTTEADEMSAEIGESVGRIWETAAVPEDRNGFFRYLNGCLHNARAQYYRDRPSGFARKPRILYEIEQFLIMAKKEKGRSLSENERVQAVSEWKGWPEKKSREYIDRLAREFIGGLGSSNDDDSRSAIPEISDEKTIDPQIEYLIKHNALIFCEVAELLLKERAKTEAIKRALLTAICIETAGELGLLEKMESVFDKEILESYKKGEKPPEQYEIYLKYHPKPNPTPADIENAGSSASRLFGEFKIKFYAALKEKNPELDIFLAEKTKK